MAAVVEVQIYLKAMVLQVVLVSLSYLFLKHNLLAIHISTHHQDNGQHLQELQQLTMFLLLVAVVVDTQ